MSLSSPGHAASLFRSQPFWEGFWVRSCGFAGHDAQMQLKVRTVDLEAKSSLFRGCGRNVWHWRSPQRRSKNGVLELARPCCFAVLKPAFLGRLLGQTSCFCRSWRPNAIEGANGGYRSQIPIFYRFWTVSLSSPGHAVSLFWRQRFWEAFTVRSRGFAGRERPNAIEG